MKKILVLGADGMLGRVVYSVLSCAYPQHVVGTTRRASSHLVRYDALHDSLHGLIDKIDSVGYVINCIALLASYPSEYAPTKQEYANINVAFPHNLEKIVEEKKARLIHFSTDAVFASKEKLCVETSTPSPDTLYGASKWLGETDSKYAITFRTSMFGFDPVHHKGLPELLLQKKTSADGFSNQQWSGATTLQIARFLHHIIDKDKFKKFRERCAVLHLTPLRGYSKYTVLKNIARECELPVIIRKTKAKSTITRSLSSAYIQREVERVCGSDIAIACKELIEYEKT